MMVTEQNILQIILIIVMSYLIGSFPTAYLIAKIHNIDIFSVGSGNMGGTNAARALGMGWGLAVIGIDISKGLIAVFLSRFIWPAEMWTATTISSIVVIIGHNWSLFVTLILTAANQGRLTIRGGKGAATAFGTLLTVAPVPTIIGMLTFGFTLVVTTRYVSLGVLSAFTVALTWVVVLVAQELLPIQYIPYALMLGVLLLWRFRDNIRRLLTGTERRLGERV